MKKMKRIKALLLVVVMLVSVAPTTGLALWSGGGEGNYTKAYLDLSDFLINELNAVPVSYIQSHLTDASGNAVSVDGSIAAYARRNYYRALDEDDAYYVSCDDDYIPVSADGTIDFGVFQAGYRFYNNYSSAYIRLLIGTADQLDRGNRFIDVDVILPDLWHRYAASAWDADGNKLYVSDNSGTSTGQSQTGIVSIFPIIRIGASTTSGWKAGDPVRIRLRPTEKLTELGLTARAYLGGYETLEEIPADMEITDALINGETGFLFTNSESISQGWVSVYEEVTFVWTNGRYTEIQEGTISIFGDLVTTSMSGEVYTTEYEQVSLFPYLTASSQTITLPPGYSSNADYLIGLSYYDYENRHNDDLVTKAVIGIYDSAEAAAEAEDVKDQLFSGTLEGALLWNFAAQGDFQTTVFDSYGNVTYACFTVQETKETPSEEDPGGEDPGPAPLSGDVSLDVYGAYDPVYSVSADTYIMSSQDDSYYASGYQTLFILSFDGEPIRGEKLVPYFWAGTGAKVFAGVDGTSAAAQVSGRSTVPVKYGRPIQYSVSAENGQSSRNYYVTFVTQAEGSGLFVNGATNSEHINEETGLPERRLILDAAHEYYHDILFANFGAEEMTGLKVELTDAQGIKLDDFWTIRPDSVGTLPPFDRGDPDNYGKIRIKAEDPTAFAAVSGKLTLSADGVDPVTVLLTGVAGRPKIITTSMNGSAVKYVPYSTLIQTNYIGDVTDAISFAITAGSLPEGVGLKPNGEVYGVPLETGTFTFTVTASLKDDPDYQDSKAYTLIVIDNTDENVENATDEGYELIDRIPNVALLEDQLFHTKGEYAEFIDAFLDGRKLVRGTDYILEEGSTKITLTEETLEGEEEGVHTIAAEFRIGGDKDAEMKRVAQNFTLKKTKPTITPDPDPYPYPYPPDYGQMNPQEAEEPKEPEEKNDEPATPEKPVKKFAFADVPADAWFYDDVKWVFDRDLMIGVSDTLFAPNDFIDAATIVTVLARSLGVDLTQFANSTERNDLPQDQWYSAAANWATQMGLIDDNFERNKPFSRAQMAELLYKYFKMIGIDVSAPETPVEFGDADQMTPQENMVFQVLYKYGIFKGIGNNVMDVKGNTSRAQLAALMQRIVNFIDSKT